MQRLNFYKLNLKNKFSDFKESLITNTTNNIDVGYISLINSHENYIHAYFYKKNLINERILNPFGIYEIQTYHSYQKIEFYIFQNKNIVTLVVLNQPKSIKYLISILKKNDSVFFSISNFSINIEEKIFSSNLKILTAKYSNVEISTHSYANIEVISNANALSDFHSLKLKGSYELSKIKVIEELNNLLFEIEFNNKATFTLKIDYLEYNLINFLYEKYIHNL